MGNNQQTNPWTRPRPSAETGIRGCACPENVFPRGELHFREYRPPTPLPAIFRHIGRSALGCGCAMIIHSEKNNFSAVIWHSQLKTHSNKKHSIWRERICRKFSPDRKKRPPDTKADWHRVFAMCTAARRPCGRDSGGTPQDPSPALLAPGAKTLRNVPASAR